MAEFLSMGGYGGYVWGSYAVAFVAVLLELVFLRSRARKHETKA